VTISAYLTGAAVEVERPNAHFKFWVKSRGWFDYPAFGLKNVLCLLKVLICNNLMSL